MKAGVSRSLSRHLRRYLIAIMMSAVLLAPTEGMLCACASTHTTSNSSPPANQNASPQANQVASAQPAAQPTQDASQPQEDAPKVPPDQLDSLVAPIALYPDPMLSQVLVASTYPLEIMQLQQWLQKHKDLKDKKLVDAVSKQPWDASIQAMAALPDVVKRLADDIQ